MRIELLAGLDTLDGWPEKVRTMQRNWIGRSEGAEVIDFNVVASGATIKVFTTRIDTIFGATSIQMAPEHPFAKELAEDPELKLAKLDAMIEQQRVARASEALGAHREGRLPDGAVTRSTRSMARSVPVWVANYILADYGTGAIMSVPGTMTNATSSFAAKYGILEMTRVVVAGK